MATQPADEAVVLLTIHPEYAEAILRGEKTVEFRRRGFSREVSHVVLYCTHPVRQITGVFAVDAIEHASPETLWRRYERCAGISHDRFFAYYSGTSRGAAIRVAKAWRLSKPLDLADLGGRLTPPQSFAYLTHHQAQSVLSFPELAAREEA